MERVLVVFQATCAGTESQALAFGLGAVEGGANIRLRHLPGAVPAALEHQGYGQIKDEDIAWADIIALAVEAPEPVKELAAFTHRVENFMRTANPSAKKAYVFGHATPTAAIRFAQSALESAGLSPLDATLAAPSDDPQYLQSVGRKLAKWNNTPPAS